MISDQLPTYLMCNESTSLQVDQSTTMDRTITENVTEYVTEYDLWTDL